jgi:hypothetical protein
MSKVNINKLINNYTKKEKQLLEQEILAPAIGRGKIFTSLDTGAIYQFNVPIKFSGWGIFQPVSTIQVRLKRVAQEYERLAYLYRLPHLRCIAINSTNNNKWLVIPKNLSDARQRNFKTEPFEIYLVDKVVQQFETVLVNTDSSNYWFHGVDRRSSPIIAKGLLKYYNEIVDKQSWDNDITITSSPEEKLAIKIALAKKKVDSIPKEQLLMQQQLSYLGANLVSYSPLDTNDNSYQVKYTDDYGEHAVTVGKDYSIISAGICLSGEDDKFDLASIVKVLQNDDNQYEY